jgi:hypothetical protein
MHGFGVSIILVFDDSFFKYVQKKLDDLEKLSFKKEIILVDNRIKNKEALNVKDDVKIVKVPYKALLFKLRYIGFLHSSMDYIWYIDADDDIYPFNFSCNGEDLIVYNFSINNIDTIITGSKDGFFNRGLWNKIFKRGLLKKAYSSMEKFNMFEDEDSMLQLGCLKFISTTKIDSQKIYNYHKSDKRN